MGALQPSAPSVLADLSATSDQLSVFLDQQHNDAVVSSLYLRLNQGSSPETVLSTVLSSAFKSTVAISSKSFSCTQQSTSQSTSQQTSSRSIGYRIIGFGQCGLVLEKPGRGYVLKIAKKAYRDGLWADFNAHLRVQEAFDECKDGGPAFRVPRILSYISKDNSLWWDQNINLFPAIHESFSLPAMTLVSEKIPPLPKIAREALINTYCAAASRSKVAANPTNRDCLIRLYLGRRRSRTAPPPNFTLHNFNLHLDQMMDLGLPLNGLASSMGEALAIVHWLACVDGYDIEFVLGSETETDDRQNRAPELNSQRLKLISPHTDLGYVPDVNYTAVKSATRLWILDFNLCHIWDESTAVGHPELLITHLVQAFFENDPYYPLPLMENDLERELWQIFSASYIAKADEVLQRKNSNQRLSCLPQRFIDGCVQREMNNLERGLSHGHRDAKQ